MKTAERPGVKESGFRFAWLCFALFCVFLLLFFTLGNGEGQVLPAVTVWENADDYAPYFMGEQGGKVFLALSSPEDSLLLRLDAATGRVERFRSLDAPLRWAALRSDSLVVREEPADGVELCTYELDGFQKVDRLPLSIPPDELFLFDCDEAGDLSYVLSRDRKALCLRDRSGGEESLSFPQNISFLRGGDPFLLCAGDTLYAVKDGRVEREIPLLSPIAGDLGGELLLERDGVVARLEEGGLTPLFQCGEEIYSPLSFCLDGENRLILSLTGGGVDVYTLSGERELSCRLESTALAVCPAGALTRQDASLRYTAFSFAAADPTAFPSPAGTPDPAADFSPSPAPELTPVSQAAPPAYAEGGYIILSPGATADELRDLLWPEAADIRDLTGSRLLHGRLATGMTANDWVLVVEGDCNGSGTVNRADLQAAAEFILDGSGADSPERRAADLNADGTVDGTDLLLLRERIN